VSKQQAAIDEVQKLADSGVIKDQITQNMR
jgi:hypothetical protein